MEDVKASAVCAVCPPFAQCNVWRVSPCDCDTARGGRSDRAAERSHPSAPKVVNRPAITDEGELGALLRDLEEFQGYFVTKAALKFQILTIVRPCEVRGMTIHEIDREARTWTISEERMKMRRGHVVPLSDQAFDIVDELWPEIEGVELLFPSVMSNRR